MATRTQAPFVVILRGTCFGEDDEHRVHLQISLDHYFSLKKGISSLIATRAVSISFTATIVRCYSFEKDASIPEPTSDHRVESALLTVECDHSIRVFYRVRHIDGVVWEAWGTTLTEVTAHFSPPPAVIPSTDQPQPIAPDVSALQPSSVHRSQVPDGYELWRGFSHRWRFLRPDGTEPFGQGENWDQSDAITAAWKDADHQAMVGSSADGS